MFSSLCLDVIFHRCEIAAVARLVAEHVGLIEAMQRREARAAARIIKAHIGQTEKRVLPALKRNAVIA